MEIKSLKNRDTSIDNLKGILVVFMIFAHIIQFFPAGNRARILSDYVNLTTFSGFMFSFGYVSYKAYFKNNRNLISRLIKGACKSYLAFCISGICYSVFVEGISFKGVWFAVVTLQRIPGYSEFLLSFALIYFFIYLIHFVKIDSSWIIFGLIAVSLLATFVDYGFVSNNVLGSIIGTNKYACFPIVQYFSFFLLGMYLSKENIIFDKLVMVISLIGLVVFASYMYKYQALPNRFPPSIYWIVGGYFFIYCYYIFVKSNYRKVLNKIVSFKHIGSKSLIYLVTSNVVIFVTYRFYGERYAISGHSYLMVLLLYLVLFLACFIMSRIICLLLGAEKIR